MNLWRYITTAVFGVAVREAPVPVAQREQIIVTGRTEDPAFTIPTINDAQRKNEKLVELARYMEGVRANIDRRRKMKKRFSHLEQALRDTMKFRMEIEAGVRTYQGGLWKLAE